MGLNIRFKNNNNKKETYFKPIFSRINLIPIIMHLGAKEGKTTNRRATAREL
jgi:hypothetical protein